MAKKEKEVKIIRTSRKSYLFFYALIIIIFGTMGIIKYLGLEITTFSIVSAIVFAVLIIKFTEIHRLNTFYRITPTHLLKSVGLFEKDVKRVSYPSISHVNLHQGVLDRFLGIGSLVVYQFSTANATLIKNINKPDDLLEEISQYLE